MKGELYDLSQKFRTGMTTTKSLGPFESTVIQDLDHNPFQLSRIGFVSHMGCHLDAPRHYFKDSPAIGDLPVSRLCAPCAVIDARKGPHGLITVEDVLASGLDIRAGDFVFFHTGWEDYFEANDPQFFEGASLSEELAQYMVDKKVGMVGIDTCTVDLAHSQRPADFQFPIHRKLLSNGVLIAECLRLRQVVGKRLQVYALPMYIDQCDGAPLRAVGVEL